MGCACQTKSNFLRSIRKRHRENVKVHVVMRNSTSKIRLNQQFKNQYAAFSPWYRTYNSYGVLRIDDHTGEPIAEVGVYGNERNENEKESLYEAEHHVLSGISCMPGIVRPILCHALCQMPCQEKQPTTSNAVQICAP